MIYNLENYIFGLSGEDVDKLKSLIENKPKEKKGYQLRLNCKSLQWEYTEISIIRGTENNPIEFEQGIKLEYEKYYVYNDIKYSYKGINKISESWDSCKDDMIEEL